MKSFRTRKGKFWWIGFLLVKGNWIHSKLLLIFSYHQRKCWTLTLSVWNSSRGKSFCLQERLKVSAAKLSFNLIYYLPFKGRERTDGEPSTSLQEFFLHFLSILSSFLHSFFRPLFKPLEKHAIWKKKNNWNKKAKKMKLWSGTLRFIFLDIRKEGKKPFSSSVTGNRGNDENLGFVKSKLSFFFQVYFWISIKNCFSFVIEIFVLVRGKHNFNKSSAILLSSKLMKNSPRSTSLRCHSDASVYMTKAFCIERGWQTLCIQILRIIKQI